MIFFFTGLMGCGKTYWASKIAQFHKLNFIDLDDYIVKNENLSIAEIFQKKNETYFRKIETKYLKKLIKENKNCIIATGGGTPCFNNNLALMKKSGKIFYLQTDIDVIEKRVIKNIKQRPLLIENTNNIKLYLKKILQLRLPFYLQSDVIIDMKKINKKTFANNFFIDYV